MSEILYTTSSTGFVEATPPFSWDDARDDAAMQLLVCPSCGQLSKAHKNTSSACALCIRPDGSLTPMLAFVRRK
jgi:hypothetical protein